MNEVQIFQYETREVRTVQMNEETWFVAGDVCEVLDITNPSVAISRLDADERSKFNLGRQGLTNIVSESGLYSLVLGSRKPEAKQFKRWITHEVIPQIRKTGNYSTTEQPAALEDLIIMQAQSVKALKQEVKQLSNTVETIQDTFIQRDPDWRKHVNDLIKGAAFRSNGDYRAIRNKSYQMLEERGHCDLGKRLRNLVQRLEDSGATKTDIEKANRMDIIEQDPKLKEIYSAIVKELSIGSMRVATV